MRIVIHAKMVIMSTAVLCAMSAVSVAQQWNGPDNPERTIWRSGNVGIGPEFTGRRQVDGLLELRRPLAGEANQQLLFSARSTTSGPTLGEGEVPLLEIDTTRVFVGAAREKASLVRFGSHDLAVWRGAIIGLMNLDEPPSADYKLAVGGKILAEEIRVRLVKDWPDRVFSTDYPLLSLPELEDYIRTHRHLPDIPSAAEVAAGGISLGDMQSKLLLKIEELTLHMIEQDKTIETLQRQLASLEQSQRQRPSANLD